MDHWLEGHSFSLSLSDTLPNEETFSKLNAVIKTTKEKVSEDFEKILIGNLEDC